MRPFPQTAPSNMTKEQFRTKYRQDIIAQSGAVVFVCGNKYNADTAKVESEASGVMEEFRIAKDQSKTLVPVGATGHAAQRIWQEVQNDLKRYYKNPDKVKKHIKMLGNEKATDDQLLSAVFAMIQTEQS